MIIIKMCYWGKIDYKPELFANVVGVFQIARKKAENLKAKKIK